MTSEALARARLLDEACDFAGAARAALEGADYRYAARLAALAADDDAFREAELALTPTPDALGLAASDLASRGLNAHAARLFSAGGEHLRAGESYAAAGDPSRAAMSFERAGKPELGARALERALRDDAGNDQVRLALAELLARHGRLEPSVRALQAIKPGTPEHARGLPLLARSLAALGLSEAAREVEQDIAQLGLADIEIEASGDGTTDDEPAAPPTASKPVLFGRFEVERDVARTPHAHVVSAIDRMTSHQVAVKLLVAAGRGTGRDAHLRFQREANALLRLRHPSMVSLVAYLPEGPAMVLEWMSGGSLADLLKTGPFAPARAAEITASVLGALGEAHRLGILHRDVKPSNVLFDEVGSPRLSDFGAAHFGDLSTTVTAGAIGTFAYMSPEQRLGKAASVASDVYAAGALLYEMLTGEAAEPQKGGFLERAPSAYHEDLDTRHDEIVAKMLAEDPADRPEDAFAARKLVERLPWSARVLPRTGPASGRTRSSRPPEASARLGPPRGVFDPRDAASTFFDNVIERNVHLVPLDDVSLPRVCSFARAHHKSLGLVLRASHAEGEAWFESPRGLSLADAGGSLSLEASTLLRSALETLHREGGVHGSVDREHVYVSGTEVTLAYPREPRLDATREDDLAALEELTAGA
ncbi:MAG: protein kinase [Polyangiaceae bacterium]|nr:protein kinase [Polyangiaceae bacterium]